MEHEEWRPVKGYELLHLVSSFGRVKALARTVVYKDGRSYMKAERIIDPKPKQGYPAVALADGKRFCIHSLVAEAFIGDKPDGAITVNHKDGNKKNNRVGNLEWATYAENNRHARLTRLNMQDGRRCNLTKFEQDAIDAVRILWPTGRFTREELGDLFKMSAQHIYEIASGRSRALPD